VVEAADIANLEARVLLADQVLRGHPHIGEYGLTGF